MKQFYYLLILFLLGWLPAKGEIRGKVTDGQKQPIYQVAVILQTTDSVFVNATTTDSEGIFSFTPEKGEYILLFQHLLYESLLIETTEDCSLEITLEEKAYGLDEISFTAERPLVKVDGGKLIYDTPQLIRDKPVTNAFEAVKELPGILDQGEGELQLLGASRLHIIINGKLTTMSPEQMASLLKTIPASRVKSTEIIYNAPARYNVKGALLNVLIEQEQGTHPTLDGEIGTEYQQRHYASGVANANIIYVNKNFSLDVMASGNKGREYGGEEMFARHTLPHEIVEIDQSNRLKRNIQNGTFRLGTDYTFNNEDKLSASYYITSNDMDRKRSSSSFYNYVNRNQEILSESNTGVEGRNRLQNIQLQYIGHQGIQAGIDYTDYHDPDEQVYKNYEDGILTTNLYNVNQQDIRKWMFFLNHTYKYQNKTFNYGANFRVTNSKSIVEHYTDNPLTGNYIPLPEDWLNDKQKEYGGNGFIQFTGNFGKLSTDVTLKAEYFRSTYNSNGKESKLWNDWVFLPALSLSYMFTPSHILQLNATSDKKYPSYWSINPYTRNINSYALMQGNPYLKPSRFYEGQLSYIFKQKYILMAFTEYEPDYFTQLSIQDEHSLLNIYRFENFNYRISSGLAAIIPFKAGRILDSRVIIRGNRLQEKSKKDFEVPFNNTSYVGMVMMNHTFNISQAKPDLKLTISGYYHSPSQQGLYELGHVYDVSAGLKWTFADGKGAITLKYNNIFNSRMPSYIRTNTGNQYTTLKTIDTSTMFAIGFTWKFGNYRKRDHRNPNDGRFGK